MNAIGRELFIGERAMSFEGAAKVIHGLAHLGQRHAVFAPYAGEHEGFNQIDEGEPASLSIGNFHH